ncbi:hypothetical protein ILYODFUR_005171 [Ilyodon furcidens]|uniref:Uncharacterized protein n=1 Tax=Ilyodon furcidens TaxID=33524 RepID=A0ABV0SXZ8_9TELE
MVSCPTLKAAKQLQTITPPPPSSFPKMLCSLFATCNTHTPSLFNADSPQNIFPNVLEILKMFSGKCDGPLSYFWSTVVFTLDLSSGCSFCPVPLLLLNRKH